MDWAQLLVVYSALGVEIGIVETASIKPQRSNRSVARMLLEGSIRFQSL